MQTKTYIKNGCFVMLYSEQFNPLELLREAHKGFKQCAHLNIARVLIDFSGIEERVLPVAEDVLIKRIYEQGLAAFNLERQDMHLALVTKAVSDPEAVSGLSSLGLNVFVSTDRNQALRRLCTSGATLSDPAVLSQNQGSSDTFRQIA